MIVGVPSGRVTSHHLLLEGEDADQFRGDAETVRMAGRSWRVSYFQEIETLCFHMLA